MVKNIRRFNLPPVGTASGRDIMTGYAGYSYNQVTRRYLLNMWEARLAAIMFWMNGLLETIES
jgi:hypothetical protein